MMRSSCDQFQNDILGFHCRESVDCCLLSYVIVYSHLYLSTFRKNIPVDGGNKVIIGKHVQKYTAL
jgi:hypothetical protein